MRREFCVHIVDDDPGVRESLKTLLGDAGYQTRCYAGAKLLLDQSGGLSGCVLIDLCLSEKDGMDGVQLQKHLIARNIPVDMIVMSAYGEIKHAVEAMRLGAVDFLEKPFDPEQLLRCVEALAESSRDTESALREARHHAALVDTLTPRELQVLRRVVDGLANKQVAAELGISPRTVETHRVHLMEKLNADSLPDLVKIWLNASARSDAGTV